MKKYHFLFAILIILLFSSCSKDDLAFDIIESPVLAQFQILDDTGTDMLKVKATFYDLDKSGILDNSIGIDSIPVAGLPIQVYVFESNLVKELTTDSDGSVILEEELSAFLSAARLEWVGTHEGTPFRIYQNY